MDNNLQGLIKSLEELKITIESASAHEDGFKRHGWHYVHLHRDDIKYLIANFISKLNGYGDAEITEGLSSTIEAHISTIESLNQTTKSYFGDDSNLVHMVPNIILTLHVVFSDIEYELFSYENITDKKLLPKALTGRLRGTLSQLDSIEKSAGDLKVKVSVINDAYEAADSLPTDLASLKEAKAELRSLIEEATKDCQDSKNQLQAIKEEAGILKNEIEKNRTDVELLQKQAENSAASAAKLVDECDDALQITTTQGLAAGFDQKAKELKLSIWVWIVGLLLALVTGAFIGAERVDAFTIALDSELTAGQAVLHTIMSIFSIGGPLWLAWISTQQINQRFKLSEDYSYKATVAKSFTGFKKFAERFDPSTEERLFNSTLDRLDEMPLRLIQGKDYNSPWHEFIDSDAFKKALDVFPSLASEAGKFANKANLKNMPKHKSERVEKKAESVTNQSKARTGHSNLEPEEV